MNLEELKKENEALKAQLKDRDEKHAKELDAKVAAAIEQTQKGGPKKIPGQIKLDLEDVDTGKKKKIAFGITDGHPTVRYEDGSIVASIALLKVANGTKLSEEEAERNPTLAKAKKEAVIAFIQKWAVKGAGWLTQLS